ncbi:MAG TPA: penicillin acylase family protein [bacterium]|nr:penicillin acylase family protein [bacterium]
MAKRIIFRIYRGIGAAVAAFFLALLVLGLSFFYIFTRKPLPQVAGKVVVAGLDSPVRVVRDKWDVPHIYARTRRDLFFASGFVQAQDRLFQMDLLRRVCEGRLAEWVGQSALPSDRLARTIGFHRQAARNLAAAPPESAEALDAYAAGVNAYIERHSSNLPLEYKALKSAVEPWEPADTLAIALYIGWGLANDWKNEVLRLGIMEERDEKNMWEIVPLYEAKGPDIVPPEYWPGKALNKKQEEGARAPAIHGLGQVVSPHAIASLFAADAALRRFFSGGMARPLCSNSWAVDGSMTGSGKPILANDPHLELTLPSVWYELHLAGAGFDVIGVTFPGIPLVVLGHNREIAWGATTTQADTEDIFIEDINPADAHQYQFQGRWVPFRVEKEKIRVKQDKDGGFKDEVLEVRVGRHGPIINGVLDPPVRADKALALSWTGFEVTDPIGAFAAVNQARDWETFRGGIQRLGCPVQNWIYADGAGNIAYIAAGLYPVRARSNGTVPVSGQDGLHEWQGFVPLDELPQFINPKSHYIVTANNRVMPPDQVPYVISYSYGPPYRAARITELLAAESGKKFSAADMAAIQSDTYSMRARRLMPLFLEVLDLNRAGDDTLERAWLQVKDWDLDMAVSSSAPTIFAETWWQALRLTYEDEMSPELLQWFLEIQSGTNAFENLLDSGDLVLFDDRRTPQKETRDDIILMAWREAIRSLTDLKGPRMTTWKWGELHKLRLTHPLGRAPRLKGVADLFNVNIRPIPRPGGRETVNNGFYLLGNGFDVVVGASMRQIVDFGDLENAGMAYPGGQCGQPFSAHYSDILPLWLRGKSHPMMMDRKEIEQAKEATLELIPAGAPGEESSAAGESDPRP